MAKKKFTPPAQGLIESQAAYNKRVERARKAHEQSATGDRRKATGADRTPAQKRADEARRGNRNASGTRKANNNLRRGYSDTSGDARTGQGNAKHKKQYSLGPCTKCNSTGRMKVGIINQRFVPCRRCGGKPGAQTWEKR